MLLFDPLPAAAELKFGAPGAQVGDLSCIVLAFTRSSSLAIQLQIPRFCSEPLADAGRKSFTTQAANLLSGALISP